MRYCCWARCWSSFLSHGRFSTSLKTEQQTLEYPPTWVPDPVQWENYPDALTARPFGRYYVNTTIITVLSVVGQVCSSAVVAYGFARFRFPLRGALFLIVLSTLMIPFHMLIIPRFILFKYLGWLDTFLPLIVPNFFGGAFSIFLLRQYFLTIPLIWTKRPRWMAPVLSRFPAHHSAAGAAGAGRGGRIRIHVDLE